MELTGGLCDLTGQIVRKSSPLLVASSRKRVKKHKIYLSTLLFFFSNIEVLVGGIVPGTPEYETIYP